MYNDQNNMPDLRFPQQCSWVFRYFNKWHCVATLAVPDILKDSLTLEDQGIMFSETWKHEPSLHCHIPADMNPEQNDTSSIVIKFNTLYTSCTARG